MNAERFGERKNELTRAVKRLEEAVHRPEDEFMRDAVIQRFEFTIELIWKALKLYLEGQGYETGSPRQTLKQAFAAKLVASNDEADIWFKMLDDRNLASHTYHEELAREIYLRVRTYLPLIQAMNGRIQKTEQSE